MRSHESAELLERRREAARQAVSPRTVALLVILLQGVAAFLLLRAGGPFDSRQDER